VLKKEPERGSIGNLFTPGGNGSFDRLASSWCIPIVECCTAFSNRMTDQREILVI